MIIEVRDTDFKNILKLGIKSQWYQESDHMVSHNESPPKNKKTNLLRIKK